MPILACHICASIVSYSDSTDRFSRELGDAVNIVKKVQKTYGIRIVSAGRGAIYDCTDHNSLFMMALEFLLGNTENLKRMNDTLQKQELIRTVFDNSLFYEGHIYRTPYLIPVLSHNELIMKQKCLLILTKKGILF